MVHLKFVYHVLLMTFVFKGVRGRASGETIIVLNEGDELLFNCSTVPERFNIIFPRNNSHSGITTSEHELVPHIASGQIVQWTFRRKKTVFGDTGQYILVHVANRTTRHHQLAVTYDYFYVYVRSMKNLFVSKSYDNLIMGAPNSSIVIPCRPTAPDVQVLLINSKTNEKVNFGESIEFDPKIGFIIKSTSVSSSTYLCRAERGSVSAQLSFTVIVIRNYARSVRIRAEKIDHLVIGQTLKLNCTVVLSPVAAKPYVIWMTPRNSAAIMRKSRVKQKNVNVTFSTELIVKNLTFNDMGLYTCDTDETSLSRMDESVFVNVYNDIEVKSSHKSYDIVESIKFKLECISWYGHSLRTLEWLNKNNETIVNDERIEVFHKDEIGQTIDESFLIKRTYLHINNISKSDEGLYTCLVKNVNNSTKSISYKVASIHKPERPYIEKTNLKGKQVVLYTPSTNVSKVLFCVIKGMPRPKTTWYKNDLPLNMSNTKAIDLVYIRSSPELLQVLFTKADSGGIYKCRGTNSFGTVEAFIEFTVIERNLPAFWQLTVIWIILVLSTLVTFFSLKVRYAVMRRNALAEIALLPFRQGDRKILHLSLADQQEEVHYDPKQWELKRKDLIFGDQLSSGRFGVMLKAQVRVTLKGEAISTVAVKKVLQISERIHRKAAVNEFKTHIYMGSHENIVRILGICTDQIIKDELLLIMEYCRYGSLLNYMLRNKSEFVDQIDPATGKIDCTITTRLGVGEIANPDDTADLSSVKCSGATYPQPGWRTNYLVDTECEKREMFCTQDLNYWAYQISYAMEYLHQKKIIHSDLAARNVLLIEEQVIKICDVGIAKTMCSDDNYRRDYRASFPIKWMAIESIKSNTFSLQSDLWSYAVTLWEIYSFAEEPYPGIPDHEIFDKLVSGYRMGKPRYAVKEVYDIMLECWNEDPVSRPSFAEIAKRLQDHAVEVTKQSADSEVPTTSNPSTDADAPKDSDADVPKDSEADAPKDSNVDEPKDSDADAPKDSNVDAPKDSKADALKDSNVDAPKDSDVDAPKDSNVDAPKDSKADALKDSNVDAPKDSEADALKDFNVDAPKDSDADASNDSQVQDTKF